MGISVWIVLLLAGDAGAPSERLTHVAGVLIPFYRPSWTTLDPLETIETLVADGATAGAREALRQLARELSGEMMRPPVAAPEGTLPRFPPPEHVLAEWWASRGSRGEGVWGLRPLAEDATQTAAIRPVSPLLWYPGSRDAARRRFEFALAAGKMSDVYRILASPNAPQISAGLRSFLVDRELARPADGRYRSSLPTPFDRRHVLPERLRAVYRLTLDGDSDFPDSPLDPETGSRSLPPFPERVPWRRTPLASVYPLVSMESAIFQGGSRSFAISTHGQPKVLWMATEDDARPTLVGDASIPTASPDGVLALTVRTSARESRLRQVVSPQTLDGETWTQLRLLRIGDDPARIPVPVRGPYEQALRNYSVAGPPLSQAKRTYIPLWRGWREVELSLCAIEENGTVAWMRPLGRVPFATHSLTDLRDKLPRVRLMPFRGELIVVSAFGWIARVGMAQGEYRGALFYPRFSASDLPIAKSRIIPGADCRLLPAPRPRLEPPAIFTRGPDGRRILIVLPPDALALLAVDLESWRIAWQHTVDRSGSLLGQQRLDGRSELVLLDLGIPRGTARVGLRRVDARTGRVAYGPAALHLAAKVASGRAREEDEALRPLLVGAPRLAGDAVWIPTLAGLEVWDLRSEPEGRPDRVLAWPEGCQGGTPIPLPRGRLLTIAPGDAGRNTAGSIEIFAGPDEVE